VHGAEQGIGAKHVTHQVEHGCHSKELLKDRRFIEQQFETAPLPRLLEAIELRGSFVTLRRRQLRWQDDKSLLPQVLPI
jgi:hypothetical protein